MKKKLAPQSETHNLREQAEASVNEQSNSFPLLWNDPKTEFDLKKLVHELQVHHVELELQNEELRCAKDQVHAGMKYADLYECAPVGYFTLDRNRAIQQMNRAGANLLGIERIRLLKSRFGVLVSMADRLDFDAFLGEVFEGKGPQTCEMVLQAGDRPSVWVRIDATRSDDGQECHLVMTDITDRKRSEEDRLVLSKLESTGILAGGIAHDFNNFLNVILLNADMAKASMNSPHELEDCLRTVKETAVAARHLTKQLLAFAAHGGVPIRKPASLSGVIDGAVVMALSGSTVRCEVSLAKDIHWVEVDEGQIGQVVLNLLLNAREAMSKGGVVSIRGRNVVLPCAGAPALPPGAYVQVSVSDQGQGISKEVLSKIFDPYFSTKQRGHDKGRGLGLTISHSVIQKHGGAISVESKLGVGTTFHFFLPACQTPLPASVEAKVAAASVPLRPLRILVMDDEECMRFALRAALDGRGHGVEEARDGVEASRLYAKAKTLGRPFDVVILDLTVRAGQGAAATVRALLEIDPEVKAIVMSGYSEDPVLQNPDRYGFKAGMEKSFDVDQLTQVLSRVMEG